MSGLRLLSKAGLGACAVWVVQLAINASSESVVTCLIMCREAPFDDGATLAGQSKVGSRK